MLSQGWHMNLDVSVLKHQLLLPLFGGDQAILGRAISATREMGLKLWKNYLTGKSQAVFLMNPTPIDEVTERAKRGERMPQKSP